MAYPHDGTPNLRPGADRIPLSVAPLFDPALSLDELFEDFIAGSASLINTKTESNYRYDFGTFRTWLDETSVAPILGSLTKQLCVDYIAALQRRPKKKGKGTLSSHSVHHYTRVIRTFVRWLVAEGYYPADPFAGGTRGIMPRLGPRELKVAKQGDIETLLDGAATPGRTGLERAVRGRDELTVWLLTDTGMRAGDVVSLAIGDIDMADGWALVKKGKWDRQRRVPLSRETIAALRIYLRRWRPILAGVRPEEARPDDHLVLSATGGPMTTNGLYQAMSRTFCRGKGEGRFGPHRLRHRFGTTAAEKGMHPRISQQIMGHEDEKSQRVYQHPSDHVVKAEHAKVTPIRDIRPSRRRKLA